MDFIIWVLGIKDINIIYISGERQIVAKSHKKCFACSWWKNLILIGQMTNKGITTMYDKDLCKMYFGQGQHSRLVMVRDKEN